MLPSPKTTSSFFKVEWAKQDHNANHWIEAAGLKKLIIDLEYPLGLKNVPGVRHMESREKQARQMIKELQIPVRAGQINFTDTLKRLASRAYALNHGDEAIVVPDAIAQLEKEKEKKLYAKKGTVEADAATIEAAVSIQAVVRGQKERKSLSAKGIPVRTITPPIEVVNEKKAESNVRRTGAWEATGDSQDGPSSDNVTSMQPRHEEAAVLQQRAQAAMAEADAKVNAAALYSQSASGVEAMPGVVREGKTSDGEQA